MKYFLAVLMLLPGLVVSAQESSGAEGTVTYVTSRSVYVSFAFTDGIAVGDTLFTVQDGVQTPCLVVDNKSSASVVTHAIANCIFEKGDAVVHRSSTPRPPKRTPFASRPAKPRAAKDTSQAPEKKERIRGRVSAASYSTFSDARDDNHRAMYRLSLTADNIAESKFSVDVYAAYRQLFLTPERAEGRKTNFFNVYNAAVRYQHSESLKLTLGRRINDKVSSLGAIDGLQAEKAFGRFYAGAIAGFRPDIFTFGFNSNLLQYGGYVGWKEERAKLRSQTTLGLLQQTNGGNIDRRYVYGQHSSTINANLNIFGSVELDIYNKAPGLGNPPARLTNLFASARYRFNRKLSVTLSYDSRRRVVFYETFRTELERMLADDEARQGARARVNYRFMKYATLGAGYTKRFQTSQQNANDNANAYLSFTKLPYVGGRLTLTGNYNQSAYLTSIVGSVRHSRQLIGRKLSMDAYARYVDYQFNSVEGVTSRANSQQYYVGLGLTYRPARMWSINVLGEGAQRASETTFRTNLRVIKRFDSKRRK